MATNQSPTLAKDEPVARRKTKRELKAIAAANRREEVARVKAAKEVETVVLLECNASQLRANSVPLMSRDWVVRAALINLLSTNDFDVIHQHCANDSTNATLASCCANADGQMGVPLVLVFIASN